METGNERRYVQAWVSADGKSMRAAISTKPGAGDGLQPYDTGDGTYMSFMVDSAGRISGGSEVRGRVTPPKEKYPPAPPPPKTPHLTYSQSNGGLFDAQGELAGRGYSGKGDAKNRPEREGEKNVGPIPRGNYRVAEIVDDPDDPRCQKMGPHILRLEPADSPTRDRLSAMGRDGFYIHGGGSDASTGCIIMGPNVRAGIGRGALLHVRR